jgi:flavin reductase (DIM6/NTAB) family NADH-FMN oxidoreductase RutF
VITVLIDFADLSGRDAYQLISEIITPRPIAWVSTVSSSGVTNLAPFSFFQGVTSRPPTLLFIPVNDRHGKIKDTVRNIEAVPEFVVNMTTTQLTGLLDRTAEPLPFGVSEFKHFGIESLPSQRVKPPRVRLAPIALECELDRIVTIGEGAYAANVVFGRILTAHIQDELFLEIGNISTFSYSPAARIGSRYGAIKYDIDSY